MKCPHCLVQFHAQWLKFDLGDDIDGEWTLLYFKCPSCSRFVCGLKKEYKIYNEDGNYTGKTKTEFILVRPKVTARSSLPDSVPEKYSKDYSEACLVLSDSPKASATLSRRCLQNLLREVVKVKPSNLSNEIEEVIKSGKLPPHLSNSIDAVRNYGNFAAHPIKSEKAGEIIDVEPGEAEWLLEVLEGLFEFYFVQPAILKAKKDALNKKLKDAGKPEMK